MRNFSFFILSMCMATVAVGQQLRVNETRFIIGDSTCGNGIYYTITTKDRGLLMVGNTDCNNVGDIIAPINDSALSLNVLICKMDSNMHVSWVKVYGGTQVDNAISVCATSDGGYAVLAGTASSNGDVPALNGAGSGTAWLIKTDANGNKLWSTVFGCHGSMSAMSVAEAPDHGFVVLSSVNGSGIDVPFIYVNTAFLQDWVLIKTDSSGNKQWSRTIGGTGDEGPYGSVLAVSNGYYIASTSTSTDHDCSDTTWHAGVNTHTDVYLIKTDTAGNVVWDSSYGGSNYESVFSAMFDIRDSSIEIVGSTLSSDYMVHDHQGYAGDENCWVIKTDKNGKLLWETTLIDTNVGGGLNQAKVITPAPNGGYAVLGNIVNGNIGSEDVRLFITDSQANVISNKMVGGTDYEMAYGIEGYKNGYALIGTTQSHVFSEGININQSPSTFNSFVSYVEYWPEALQNVREETRQLLCYPNPGQNKIRVKLAGGNLNGDISIVNNAGRKVFAQKTTAAYLDIETRKWARGGYIVAYRSTDGEAISCKITIE